MDTYIHRYTFCTCISLHSMDKCTFRSFAFWTQTCSQIAVQLLYYGAFDIPIFNYAICRHICTCIHFIQTWFRQCRHIGICNSHSVTHQISTYEYNHEAMLASRVRFFFSFHSSIMSSSMHLRGAPSAAERTRWRSHSAFPSALPADRRFCLRTRCSGHQSSS